MEKFFIDYDFELVYSLDPTTKNHIFFGSFENLGINYKMPKKLIIKKLEAYSEVCRLEQEIWEV